MNQKPIVDCEREDCRILNLGSSTTLLGWTPVYDKYGNDISVNPNKTTTHYRCSVCGRDWTETK